MKYRILHDEWFLNESISKLDVEVYSFLLAKLAMRQSYLKKSRQPEAYSSRQISSSLREILENSSLGGESRYTLKKLKKSLLTLEKINYLTLNEPISKQRNSSSLEFRVELLWDAVANIFVSRETKSFYLKTGEGSELTQKCVDLSPRVDTKVCRFNSELEQKCVDLNLSWNKSVPICFQDNGFLKDEMNKSGSIIIIKGINMKNEDTENQNRLPSFERTNDELSTELSTVDNSYFCVDGIKDVPLHFQFVSEFSQYLMSKNHQGLDKLMCAPNIASILAPELRDEKVFKFTSDLTLEKSYMLVSPEKAYYGYIHENDFFPDVDEAVINFFREHPRGVFWSRDSGAPWAGPKIPFFYFESSKDYYNQPGFSRHSPFPRMKDIYSLQQVMNYDFPVEHPRDKTKKVPLYKIYSAPARMMFWLMATTGVTVDAIREHYNYYVSQVTNPNTTWAKTYKKEPKMGHDWLVNFRDFLVGVSFTNRVGYPMRNEENRYVLKFPGDEVMESQPFFGNIFWYTDKTGRRQEVYMTTYQSDYHTEQIEKRNAEKYDYQQADLDNQTQEEI